MNVVCGQCGTGYEFDDALVSDRGTTVRCMHCGHQFRVHPERAKPVGAERWIVRKGTGEEYIFRSLSELQRAIAHRRVVISDSLSRDGVRFRPMRELSELESFFDQKPALTPSAPAAAAPRPGAGFSRPPNDPMAITPTAAISVPAVPTPRGGFSSQSGGTQALSVNQAPSSGGGFRQSGMTQPGGLGQSTPGQSTPGQSMPARPNSATPGPLPSHQARPQTPAVGIQAARPGGVAAGPAPGEPRVAGPRPAGEPRIAEPRIAEPRVAEPRPAQPRIESRPAEPRLAQPRRAEPNLKPATPVAEPKPPAVGVLAPTLASDTPVQTPEQAQAALPRRRRGGGARPSQPAIDNTMLAGGIPEPSSSHVPAPLSVANEHRSGGPRWIIALVLLGGLALVAGTVGRDYFERFRETRAPAAQADTRVETFLAAGDEQFRAGDWEEARAQYEKASALAENDPAVLQRLLQVETTRADVDWLRLRILAQSSPDFAVVQSSFRERVGKLQRRVDQFRAAAAATPTPEGVIAVVDALRVEGQLSAARTLVQQTSGLTNEANSAYVSAMLDVSDTNPNWGSIVSRLKVAVAGERGLGRAQSALVYSLISAGQVEEAHQQLEVLAGFKRQSPLLPDLQALWMSANAAQQVEPKPATVEPAAATTTSEPTAKAERGGGGDEGLRSDDPMAEAAEARAAGELAKAARLYTLALSKNPANVAAMTGLGDVARSQGNSDIAMSHYGAALRANPNYGPAVLSCADLKWSTGDRAGAVELYRRLSGGAPSRVGDRISEFEKGSAPKAEAAPAPAPQPEAVPAPAPEPAPAVPGPATPGPAAQEPTPAQGTP